MRDVLAGPERHELGVSMREGYDRGERGELWEREFELFHWGI